MRASLLFLLFAATLSLSRAQDVVWYIGSNGSSDLGTCGRTIESPCINLTVILEGSQLFGNSTGFCRMSSGDDDGRTSTTLNFLEGKHFVDPACLSNWSNLRISGLGSEGSITITTRNGGLRGLFEFNACTGISISNIIFDTAHIGRATLFFGNCRDITITDSSFSVDIAHTRGVEMSQCSGDISVTRSSFRGNPELASQVDNFVIGLSVAHGCQSNALCECSSPPSPFQLSVTDTTFTAVTSGGEAEDNYGSTKTRGTALRVLFHCGSSNSSATFDNITVTRSASQAGSSVLVNFDRGSNGNTVSITRSKFTNNHVRYGGGVAAYFYSNPINSYLNIEDCVFEDNDAAFEGGGVFATFLGTYETNSIRVARSMFTRNTALIGAGVFLLSNPFWFSQRGVFDPVSSALITANLTDCTFVGNRADLKEGVVSLLRVILYVDGVSVFTNNSGSALQLRLSLAFFSGEVSFVGNMADSGGAINIREGSRVDLSGVSKGLFAHNKAVFAGGAVFADSASTSKLAVEYNHTLAQGVFGTCFMMFGNEPTQAHVSEISRRFTFVGNNAVSDGQSIYSYSLRGCIVSNFVPNVTASNLLIPQDGTIAYEDPSILDNTSTGPSNLFFYGASTKCYKTVANVTYLLPNCSHNLLNQTFSSRPGLQCGLDSLFNYDLRPVFTPGTGLRPPINKLYTPWASIGASWTLAPGRTRQSCDEADPGNLVLSPAPGEKFDITIQLADELLNYVSSTIYIDVEHDVDSPPGVLLQLNGIQYAYNDRVYFTPNRALSGLTIVGLPGTVGKLRVVADSQVMGQTIQLLIPFQLSQCPLGYFNPPGASTVEEVNRLILTTFSVTQRIPSDQPLACQCFNQTDLSLANTNPFFTQCIQGYTVLLSSLYWAGLITMETGSSPLLEEPCPSIPPNPLLADDGGYSEWVRQSRFTDTSKGVHLGFDPVDVVPGEEGVIPGGGAPVVCFNTRNVSELIEYKPPGEFTVDVCTRGYCRGDAQSVWFLSDVGYPCIDNREGVLCGQCTEGFAVTVYTTTCYDCRGKEWEGAIALLTSLIGGFLLVVLVIVFKLGVSPSVDSMLFFIQSVLVLLSGRTDYAIFTYYLPFFNPDFSFNLCIFPELTAYGRLLLQFCLPVYIVILLLIVLALTKYTRLSRQLGKHSFLQGLWLLFIVSYFNISNTLFELLHCRITTSVEGGSTQYLLSHDATVQCFTGIHLPAGIVASVLVVILIFPMPLYVYIAMLFPKYKPVTDVYCSSYKDSRRWWVSVSILRRLVLVVLGVYIQDYVWRHFALLLCLGLIQVVYVSTWPYKTKVDNYFGFYVGWVLLFVGLITQPALYLYVDVHRIVSMLTVTLTIFVSLCLVVLETMLRRKNLSIGSFGKKVRARLASCFEELRKPKRFSGDIQEMEESTQSTFSAIVPRKGVVDATSYREPLLDSTFTSDDTFSTSRDSKMKESFEKTKRWRVSMKKNVVTKETKSIEAMPGSQSRTSVTIVSPENGSGYLDTGIAATSYIAGPQ